MGVYMYIYTGGEPLVRKEDLIALCEKHSDCQFLSFTNATLIDEAFAIGVAQPVSLLVDTFGTGKLPADQIQELLLKMVDLRPSAIIDRLSLRTPFYGHTASYGHFGSNTANLPWEQTNLLQLWQDMI